MTGTVLTELDAETGVRTITLNRPDRLNAITDELLKDFNAALEEAEADAMTRAVILTGAGRAFCAGDDLKDFSEHEWDEASATANVEAIQDVTRHTVLGTKIYVGAIHGWAAGGGLEWVINCDLPIVADTARFFFPELSIGLFVTGAVTTLLPRLAGLPKAKELILFSEKFGAQEALEAGIAWKVVPEADLMAEARAVAEKVAALPPDLATAVKRGINMAAAGDIKAAMKFETRTTIDAVMSAEAAERIRGFGS